jgi:hypothetical protein
VQTTPDPATTSTPKPTGGVTFDWSPVEPKPRTLQVSETERDYMVSLATVIGRSPRSVKRFVNCYRLLKSSMDPADLARSTRDGSFRTTMLLLGIVSGLPEIAPELLTDLRAAPKETAPDEWARGAAERLALDARGKWGGVLAALQSLPSQGISSIAPLATVAGTSIASRSIPSARRRTADRTRRADSRNHRVGPEDRGTTQGTAASLDSPA